VLAIDAANTEVFDIDERSCPLPYVGDGFPKTYLAGAL
jgi:hypothetical protein